MGFEQACKWRVFSREVCTGVCTVRASPCLSDAKFGGYAALMETSGTDPLLCFLYAAPIDDEPVTAEEEAALAEVEADRAAGVPTIPFDEIKRRHA